MKRLSGFSLMEMMTVLLITSIIAAASAPMINKKMMSDRKANSVVSCQWQSTDAGIAYNSDSDIQTVSIGSAEQPNNILSRLNISSDNVATNPQITLSDTSGSTSSTARLFFDNGGIGLTTSNSNLGSSSIAFGDSAISSGTQSIAIGDNSNVSSKESIAIGKDASTSANYTTIIGSETSANDSFATVIGHSAKAKSKSSIALGYGSSAGSGNDTIAIGTISRALGRSSIAIGANSRAGSSTTSNCLAIGPSGGGSVKATGNSSIAIGSGANATKEGAIAFGKNAIAKHENSIAIGNNAKTIYNNQITLGSTNQTVFIPGDLVVEGRVLLAGNKGSGVYMRSTGKSGSNNQAIFGFTSVSGNSTPHYLMGNEIMPYFLGKSYSSDRRLKNVSEAFKGGLAELKKLDLFHYTYKKDESKTPHIGVIAQDLQKVFPDAITKGADGFLRIRLEDMFYALINSVKELDAKFDLLAQKQKKIDELEAKLDKLEKRLEKLEKQK